MGEEGDGHFLVQGVEGGERGENPRAGEVEPLEMVAEGGGVALVLVDEMDLAEGCEGVGRGGGGCQAQD